MCGFPLNCRKYNRCDKGSILDFPFDLKNTFRYNFDREIYVPIYNFIVLYSPIDSYNVDNDKYPLFRDANYIQIEQKAGELLIIPPGWFHQVLKDLLLKLQIII